MRPTPSTVSTPCTLARQEPTSGPAAACRPPRTGTCGSPPARRAPGAQSPGRLTAGGPAWPQVQQETPAMEGRDGRHEGAQPTLAFFSLARMGSTTTPTATKEDAQPSMPSAVRCQPHGTCMRPPSSHRPDKGCAAVPAARLPWPVVGGPVQDAPACRVLGRGLQPLLPPLGGRPLLLGACRRLPSGARPARVRASARARGGRPCVAQSTASLLPGALRQALHAAGSSLLCTRQLRGCLDRQPARQPLPAHHLHVARQLAADLLGRRSAPGAAGAGQLGGPRRHR